MSPFLQFVQEMLPALSQMLAVYGFGIAFFLYISQTETYNRVAWFAKKADDHHVWVAIFNTSRRYLVRDQIYREHLSIVAAVAADAADAADASVVEAKSKKAFGDVQCQLPKADDGTIRVDIDYMDRKSALVVELESARKIERVQVRGIIKDGRLLETSFEWDDRLHCPCFNMLVYIFLPSPCHPRHPPDPARHRNPLRRALDLWHRHGRTAAGNPPVFPEAPQNLQQTVLRGEGVYRGMNGDVLRASAKCFMTRYGITSLSFRAKAEPESRNLLRSRSERAATVEA